MLKYMSMITYPLYISAHFIFIQIFFSSLTYKIVVSLVFHNCILSLLPKKANKKRGWINDEILSKMEHRKNVKNETTEYNIINKEIIDECRQAKENWLNEQCEEIESLEKQHKNKRTN